MQHNSSRYICLWNVSERAFKSVVKLFFHYLFESLSSADENEFISSVFLWDKHFCNVCRPLAGGGVGIRGTKASPPQWSESVQKWSCLWMHNFQSNFKIFPGNIPWTCSDHWIKPSFSQKVRKAVHLFSKNKWKGPLSLKGHVASSVPKGCK